MLVKDIHTLLHILVSTSLGLAIRVILILGLNSSIYSLSSAQLFKSLSLQIHHQI
jgi:hypothetical protein